MTVGRAFSSQATPEGYLDYHSVDPASVVWKQLLPDGFLMVRHAPGAIRVIAQRTIDGQHIDCEADGLLAELDEHQVERDDATRAALISICTSLGF